MMDIKLVLIALLAFFNLALIGLITRSTPTLQAPLPQKLKPIYGEKAKANPAKPTLLIFFNNESECGCLDDWPNWREAHRRFEANLVVKGIFTGENRDALVEFCEAVSPPFPVFEDPSGSLEKRFGVRGQDVAKILLDPNGQILFADTRQTRPEDQQYFLRRLKRHLYAF